MRNYPQLTEQRTTRDFIETFGGLNRNIRISDGEFADMENLTSDHYPVLATRSKRGTYLGEESFGVGLGNQIEYPVGLIAKDGLCLVTVTEISGLYKLKIRIGEYVHEFEQFTPYDASVKRNVVSMGAYIVIFPDKVYINTADTSDKGSFEREWKNLSKLVM